MGVYIKGFIPMDGLYVIKDGVIRKYKGKGGTVRPYELVEVEEPHDEGYKQGRYDEKVEAETSLPNWEQTHALRTETHACDSIKRQDAIDAAVEAADEWDGGYSRSREEIITLKLRMLPSAQPEIKTDGDTISRAAAIDALKNRWKKTRNYVGIGDDIAEECELCLKQVPSAQPERKKGKWINRSLNILYPERERYTCSVCGKHSYNYDFCPNCGSYNGGENYDKG